MGTVRNTTAAAQTAVPVSTKSPMPAFPAMLAVPGFVALASGRRLGPEEHPGLSAPRQLRPGADR
ncbi:hypothetical protein [Methanosphaerula subterraneus]|uniref:hypothetical protein n=1 Tax=Methanosphaerula subterraneus TaxID=3350244 RepID=UPI003F85409C